MSGAGMTGEALAGEAAPATASGYRRGVPAARDQRQSPQPPDQDPEPTGFQVQLANFTGPFDLLLQLISKHKLDVTEVSLSKVTDEFISYIKGMGDAWDLDEASEFLLVASTLLDLKAARLLPAAEVEDEADLALLEARDLLFARLLQYQAFKEAAAHLAGLERAGARRYPRAVRLEPRYAEALPEVLLGIGPQRLAELAVKAMTPPQPKVLSIAHVHMVRVSVREHAAVLRDRLLRAGVASFRALTADCGSTLEVVARFLALLELYREGVVGFDQAQPLGDLTVRWTGARDWSASFEVDEYAGAPAEGVAESRSPAPAETEPDQPEPTETGSAGAAAGGVTPQPTDHGAEPGTPPSDGAETPQPRGEQT